MALLNAENLNAQKANQLEVSIYSQMFTLYLDLQIIDIGEVFLVIYASEDHQGRCCCFFVVVVVVCLFQSICMRKGRVVQGALEGCRPVPWRYQKVRIVLVC